MDNPADSPFSVELWEVSRLIPYGKNTKLHPEEQIARLAATIDRYGWDQPIVVDGAGVIIKGHGRRLAALKLGIAHVPVLVRSDLSKAEADALRISDNAVFGLQVDMDALQDEITRLMGEESGIELAEFGFDEDLFKRIEGVLSPAFDSDGPILDGVDGYDDKEEPAPHKNVSISKLFGFKSVTPAQAHVIKDFTDRLQSDTGKTGAEAFLEWVARYNAGEA